MSDRAGQFMPFAALKGFYDLIREREKIVVPKHEIADDKAEELSIKINEVKKGSMVRVLYYSNGEYINTQGVVSKIDIDLRKLIIVKTEINLDDIWDIELNFTN